MRNTLKAYERLKREQHIDTLFRNGKAFSVFPLKLVYLLVPRVQKKDAPVLAGFSVSKKKFRHSVDRQRVKRLMREAWRVQKSVLLPVIPGDVQLHVFLIFTSPELPEYVIVSNAVTKGIERLLRQFPASTGETHA